MLPLWKSKHRENYLGGNYYETQFLEGAHYLLLIGKINLSPPFHCLGSFCMIYIHTGRGLLWIKAENVRQH